jgi:hypothetical protein
MTFFRTATAAFAFSSSIFLAGSVSAASIAFSGNLDHVAVDSGAATFSAVALGTAFNGTINDVTTSGQITGGGVTVNFGCCIAAGGLSITNNRVLPAEEANVLNVLAGSPQFSAGQVVDIIDIEGDVATASNGRIEVGISYLFAQNTFADQSPSNYPFDPAVVQMALFFVLEQDAGANDIYHGLGRITTPPIPEPEIYAMLLLGLAAVGLATRRASRKS